MKIAAPYTYNDNWKNIPDEYNLLYTKKSNTQKLIDFCEVFPEKRINLYFKNVAIDFSAIEFAKKFNNNIYIRLNPDQFSFIDQLKEKEIPFFFDHSLTCYSPGMLDFMINVGVSDIYISDILCYHMPQVKEVCKKNNIQIRLILNKIPTSEPGAGKDPRSPIFSPRDMDLLDNFIDVGEFDCGEDESYNWNKFNVLYKNFFLRKDWSGFLSNLNEDVEFDYPVSSTIPNMNERKILCRRACSLGFNCTHCENLIEISNKFYNKGLKLIKPKGKKEEENN